MSAFAVPTIVFIAVLASATAGPYLRKRLPEHHLTDQTKDIVKVGIGFLSTLAALALGLLVASAKTSYDTRVGEVQQSAARTIMLDRTLRQYGPDADGVRESLRRLMSQVIAVRLEGQRPAENSLAPPGMLAAVAFEQIEAKLNALQATSPVQQRLLAQALQITNDLRQTTWLVAMQTDSPIPIPFLVVMVFWIAVISATLGIFAPSNGTVVAVAVLSALSVASAVFLIIEMDRPDGGVFGIPQAPLRVAMSIISK